ncbi:MAG: hypothetical protein M1826_002663 [Phylliscum demangeonii]|nr:MAG: hypothetical protein M1826_002663 [Phylliscum demangeonii]
MVVSPNVDMFARVHETAALPPPGTPQSVALPNSGTKDRSPVYRHWKFQDVLLRSLHPEITTAHDVFEWAATRYATSRCLGHRPYDPVSKTFGPYQWMDFQTVSRRRADVGAGLIELHRRAGVAEEPYGVGLWCQNRPEWQLIDLGCMSQSLWSVSLYETLGPDASEWIINQSGLVGVAASLHHLPTLLRLKARCPTLKLIVSLDPLDHGERPGESKGALLSAWAEQVGIQITDLAELEALGRSHPRPYHPPTADDLVTVNYSSGTTGNPKGVRLTHANAVSAVSSGLSLIPHLPGDVICSYLPLAHIFQRASELAALWSGTAIGYFHGNVLELLDDLKLLRPTLFISVPRLYNRFGSALRAGTVEQAGVQGAVARHVVSVKQANLQQGQSNRHWLYDRLWSRKVAAALGLERARMMISGSAPLDPSLHDFLRIVCSNDFRQGYGLTETYASACLQLAGDVSTGNCGPMVPGMEGCLLDVPEMDYLHTDQPQARGELLLRGASTFPGYHGDPAATAYALLPDGWLRTGDICTVDGAGRFAVIDRVKNILKLAHGEYISPERIENVFLAHCSWLAQAFVHGDSAQPRLVAMLTLNSEPFARFAGHVLGRPIAASNQAGLAAAACDERVRRAAVAELERVARQNQFQSYERVRHCRLYLDPPFTVENELLTPTLKLKRHHAARQYRAVLDQLFEEANRDELERAAVLGGFGGGRRGAKL